jgi:hypothetical protein
MEKVTVNIKKELSVDKFEQLLHTFKEELHNNTDIPSLNRAMDIYVKEITPAKHTHLLYLSSPSSLEVYTKEGKSVIDISTSKGMIQQCIQTQKPLYTNDIRREKNYEEKTDNIAGYPLKNLLLLPLFDINNHIFGLLWAAIPKGDINQYIPKDIEYLTRLSEQISYVISPQNTQKEIDSEPVEENPPKEDKNKVEEKEVEEKTEITIEKESVTKEKHEKASNEAPALIKKIRSIFSRGNKTTT